MSRVYAQAFFPNVRAYDLVQQINEAARKYGIEDERPFVELKGLMYRFTMERTALANGRNGERFYLQKDARALAKHDETHLFEIGVNSKDLSDKLDECINLLNKQATITDEYADTFSIRHPGRDADLDTLWKPDDKLPRVLTGALVASLIVVVLCILFHTLFGIGICGRWFL